MDKHFDTSKGYWNPGFVLADKDFKTINGITVVDELNIITAAIVKRDDGCTCHNQLQIVPEERLREFGKKFPASKPDYMWHALIPVSEEHEHCEVHNIPFAKYTILKGRIRTVCPCCVKNGEEKK